MKRAVKLARAAVTLRCCLRGAKLTEVPKMVFDPAKGGSLQSLGRFPDKLGRAVRNDASLALGPVRSEFIRHASVLVSYTQFAADTAAILKNIRIGVYRCSESVADLRFASEAAVDRHEKFVSADNYFGFGIDSVAISFECS